MQKNVCRKIRVYKKSKFEQNFEHNDKLKLKKKFKHLNFMSIFNPQ